MWDAPFLLQIFSSRFISVFYISTHDIQKQMIGIG